MDAPVLRTAEDFSFCDVLQVYDSSTCPRFSQFAFAASRVDDPSHPPYFSVLHHCNRDGGLRAWRVRRRGAESGRDRHEGRSDRSAVAHARTRITADHRARRTEVAVAARQNRPSRLHRRVVSGRRAFRSTGTRSRAACLWQTVNRPGPTLCLTAVLHGDEHNGLEIVRRVLYEIDPTHLSGAVIGVPIVNLDGFRRGTRYLPDRRDLNRYFPARNKAAQRHGWHTRCSMTSSSPAPISSTSTPARFTAPTSLRCAAI